MRVFKQRLFIFLIIFIPEDTFKNFMREWDKTYENESEKARRFEIFKNNLKVIEKLNEEEQDTAFYGITQFSDLSDMEFKQRFTSNMSKLVNGFGSNNYQKDELLETNSGRTDSDESSRADYLSWIYLSTYPKIENQGTCGACWAFAVTGVVASLYGKYTGRQINLSEQQLVDCNIGGSCKGNFPTVTFFYVATDGLVQEKDYPYEMKKGDCRTYGLQIVAKIRSSPDLKSENEYASQLRTSPILVGISSDKLQHYKRGVINAPNCKKGRMDLDHAVVIVGYGSGPQGDYWELRNSWGPHWGLAGHAKIRRGVGMCGVGTYGYGADADKSCFV